MRYKEKDKKVKRCPTKEYQENILKEWEEEARKHYLKTLYDITGKNNMGQRHKYETKNIYCCCHIGNTEESG